MATAVDDSRRQAPGAVRELLIDVDVHESPSNGQELMQFLLATIERKRLLLPLPFGLARFQASLLQFMPKPLLTPDQVKLLRHDNVVTPGALGLADLGIVPTTVEAEVPAYLWRFRPKGQYADLAKVG